MTIEDELKKFILSKYDSIRNFAIKIDMPYSTIDSIFKRGVEKASIANIIRICAELSISVDALAAGRIEYTSSSMTTREENLLLHYFRAVNPEGQTYILSTARMVAGNPAMQKDASSGRAI